MGQLLQPARPDHAVRRLQAVRLRPRTRQVRNRSLHADQIGLDEAVALCRSRRAASKIVAARQRLSVWCRQYFATLYVRHSERSEESLATNATTLMQSGAHPFLLYPPSL